MIEMSNQLGLDYDDQELKEAIDQANELLAQHDINKDNLQDKIVVSFIHSAHLICQKVVHYQKQDYNQRDRQIDKILTNRWTGVSNHDFITCFNILDNYNRGKLSIAVVIGFLIWIRSTF